MLTKDEMERTARANGHHDVALLLQLDDFERIEDVPPALLPDLLALQAKIMRPAGNA